MEHYRREGKALAMHFKKTLLKKNALQKKPHLTQVFFANKSNSFLWHLLKNKEWFDF
jgi:hypothetical protein